MVTGATGLVGKELVSKIVKAGHYAYTCSRNKNADSPVPVISSEELLDGKLPKVDVVVNCAFARSNQATELCAALDFTTQLIKVLEHTDVDGVINVSSQGVYKRLPAGELAKESSPVEPVDLYSMAKYATEKLFEASTLKNYTNVRLSSINMKQRFLARFVECVKNGEPIHLNSPQQYASLLDVEDAATGLLALAIIDPAQWMPVYNLGIGQQYTLLEYAELVKQIGASFGYTPEIEVSDNGICTTAGMDISRIAKDCGWRPAINNEMMIKKLFGEN